ncbi:ABC transporter [Streptomyces yaanensis]|uniref:ABC transporter n=1 Tax=Streptomyces yaanensis TaxID=1142239 RepID=A0ABV7S8W3_9ACTN|nr:ABC transporter [Streptomyces sp. CGMCC 4.7035]WNC02736.1 ABC transporter [Streptomyces sp. CGMCC 4.7035]
MLEAGNKYARISALLPPVWRTLPWPVLGAAGGSGLALAAVTRLVPGELDTTPALILLRAAALVFALGLAFLLDDPARHLTEAVPTRRPVRTALRMALVAPPAGLCWTAALLLVPGEIRPPAGAVTLEAAALAALALIGAAAAVRFTDEPQPGARVAAMLLATTVLAVLLRPRWALFVAEGDPGWAAAHQRWAVLLALILLVGAMLLPEPIRRHRAMDSLLRAHR